LILFRIPKSSIPSTRRPPLPASGLVVSIQDSKVLCPLRSEVKLLVGGTRKIRNTTLTQVTVSNTFNNTVRAQRDCNSPCK
jgi:hypothetical protein